MVQKWKTFFSLLAKSGNTLMINTHGAITGFYWLMTNIISWTKSETFSSIIEASCWLMIRFVVDYMTLIVGKRFFTLFDLRSIIAHGSGFWFHPLSSATIEYGSTSWLPNLRRKVRSCHYFPVLFASMVFRK